MNPATFHGIEMVDLLLNKAGFSKEMVINPIRTKYFWRFMRVLERYELDELVESLDQGPHYLIDIERTMPRVFINIEADFTNFKGWEFGFFIDLPDKDEFGVFWYSDYHWSKGQLDLNWLQKCLDVANSVNDMLENQ